MYNRYLASCTAAPHETPHEAPHETPPQDEAGAAHASSLFSDLSRALSGKLHGIKLDSDTMLALIIVWFLLKDEQELDWDLLLLIGGLLLLGI